MAVVRFAIALVSGSLAPQLADVAAPSLPLLALVAVLAVAIVAAVQLGVAAPRHTAVGGRARTHAVLLAMLPAASHPDAAGHARPRAPGLVLPVA